MISYLGEIPNKSSADLMKDYGFMMPGNLNDVIELEGRDGESSCRPAFRLLLAKRLAAGAGYYWPMGAREGALVQA